MGGFNVCVDCIMNTLSQKTAGHLLLNSTLRRLEDSCEFKIILVYVGVGSFRTVRTTQEI